MSYLTRLTLRLAAGALQLPDEVRRRHAAWLAALQRDDGAFPNRSGRADLYYTGFALRGLALAGFLEDQTARRAGEFLQAHLSQALPPVDFLSLVSSAVLLEAVAGIDVFGQAGVERGLRVVESTEPFRRGDGGYAKSEAGQHSSTYQTFLVAACRELVGVAVDDPVRLATLAKQRQRADGGFVELRRTQPQRHQSDRRCRRSAASARRPRRRGESRAAEFLAAMQNPEGGLREHQDSRGGPVKHLCGPGCAGRP